MRFPKFLRNRFQFISLIIFIILQMIGCSRFSIVQTVVQVPPRDLSALDHISRLAVIDFGSDKHPELADAITNKLLERLLKTKRFTIVEREKVKKLIGELHFQLTEYVDPSTIVEAGKILGVDHLLLGSVLSFRAQDDVGNFTDMESVQDGFNIIYVDGRPVEVPRWIQVPIQRNFTVRQVSVSISFRVVDAENGTIRVADSITRTYTSQRAVDGRALLDRQQLLEDLLEQCISEIMTHFDHYNKRVECNLSKRKGLKKGNRYIQTGLLQEAENFYRSKLEKYPNSADVNFNLGVIMEIKNNLKEAEQFYQKAFSLDDECEVIQNRLRIVRARLISHNEN